LNIFSSLARYSESTKPRIFTTLFYSRNETLNHRHWYDITANKKERVKKKKIGKIKDSVGVKGK